MILDRMAAAARERAARRKKEIPFGEIRERAERIAEQEGAHTFPFETAMRRPDISFICEVKKASPSKGVIAEAFPYLDIALEYEKAGADSISVLTEPDHFQGSDRFLEEISQRVSVPTLRKDIIIDPYMLYEAKTLGASCVLLIAALLDTDALRSYKAICDGLGLSALIEAHDAAEIRSALDAGARLIGVNNRDLDTFDVDISNSIRLRELVPGEVLFVAESGIRTPEDIQALRACGADGVLIGETLMRSSDKAAQLRRLKGR